MTVVSRVTQSGNAPQVHIEMEPFHVYAAPELAAAPLAVPGICFNPGCSRPFTPGRDWAIYCSAVCRRVGEAEMRLVGTRVAPALLAWDRGRSAKPGPVADLSRAGRRYYSAMARAWIRDRAARIAAVEDG